MKNFFLPGFATYPEFYSKFLKLVPGIEYIPNPSFTWDEVDAALHSRITGSEKANLLGWSLGALFALRWTITNPGKVHALFLTGATACFCARANYDNGIKEKTLHLMLKQLPGNYRIVMRNFYHSALAGVAEKETYLEEFLAQRIPAGNLLNGLHELLDTDLLSRLDQVTVPVHIYHGAEDSITPLAGAQILKQKLMYPGMIVEPGSGHCLLLQYPEKTAGQINAFVAEQNRCE